MSEKKTNAVRLMLVTSPPFLTIQPIQKRMAQDGDPRSSPSTLSSIGLCLFDLFSKRDGTDVADDCYQRPYRSVRSLENRQRQAQIDGLHCPHLIVENGEERLEHQHDNLKDKTPTNRH